jgi:hypothetical protein
MIANRCSISAPTTPLFDRTAPRYPADFKTLPVSGEYMHAEAYDISKRYGKDTLVMIDKLGTDRLPADLRHEGLDGRAAEQAAAVAEEHDRPGDAGAEPALAQRVCPSGWRRFATASIII